MNNLTSRTITGGIMIIFGLVLAIAGFFLFPLLFYGIPIFIIGLIIFFNKKEDKIELIKSRRKNK